MKTFGSVPNISPPSLALLTDLYELTMACGYWKSGTAHKEAVFHLFFRTAPFGSGFTLAAGLASAIDWLCKRRFEASDLAYLATVRGRDQERLFEPPFLDYLSRLKFECDVDAVTEGTIVFPYEPLLRVHGPILQAQLLETPLLNFLNFQSLIATKAARICLAAQGDPVIEFGLRRAQGIDGGLTASRAAYIGGCAGTSNVLAGKTFGIPVRGTHAHSWVMSFDSEPEAFAAYAQAMPNNCIFLVDTYNSLAGVRRAVQIGRQLRQQGYEMAGIRLDSGDLAALSIQARKILDEGGFPDATIMGSNDLDEHLITNLKQKGAIINAWGVGTRLVTGWDQPALGGVYKLSAVRQSNAAWENKVKLSEQVGKTTTPGVQQVRRFRSATEFIGDAIYDVSGPLPDTFTIVDPLDPTCRKSFELETPGEDILLPIFRRGQLVYESPALDQVRDRAQQQMAMLPAGIKRLADPDQYSVGLEVGLHDLTTRLVRQARGEAEAAGCAAERLS
jgi:nicotinate phosphoribosyltransferase